MTNIQAFVLALIILTIQTTTLIVFGFGFVFDVQGVIATFLLFVVVDSCLCACADILKIVKGELH